MKNLILLISTCFGIGKIPVAPGTFGSLFGLLLFFVFLSFQNIIAYACATVLSVAASVYFCDVAEKLVGKKDPSEVVLDEIVAIPVCYIAWIILLIIKTHHFPAISVFLTKKNLAFLAGIFITFRLLDAIKPFPLNHIQKLPGGWGIVADDILAAVITNIIWLVILLKIGV